MVGPDEDEPKTLPWPLNLPVEEAPEKGLLTFFMNPLTLSFTSSMAAQMETVVARKDHATRDFKNRGTEFQRRDTEREDYKELKKLGSGLSC